MCAFDYFFFCITDMAEEVGDTKPFSFVPQGGSETNTNKDYTGVGKSSYPNGDSFEGEFVKGVI